MDKDKLQEILKAHKDWLDSSGVKGERADLRNANLRDADLPYANLQGADLQGANLQYANLRGVNLRGANLQDTNLQYANLRGASLWGAKLRGADLQAANLWGAKLRGADLQGANLWGAKLLGADLQGANLRDADLREETLKAYTSITPEGSLIGWKKCYNNVIVKLLIPEESKRSNATGRKCRAEYVEVIEVIGGEFGISQFDANVKYHKGAIVKCDNWDENRWNEVSGGIHFFLTKYEAENY